MGWAKYFSALPSFQLLDHQEENKTFFLLNILFIQTTIVK